VATGLGFAGHVYDSRRPRLPFLNVRTNQAVLASRFFAEGARELAHGYASEATKEETLPFRAGFLVSNRS